MGTMTGGASNIMPGAPTFVQPSVQHVMMPGAPTEVAYPAFTSHAQTANTMMPLATASGIMAPATASMDQWNSAPVEPVQAAAMDPLPPPPTSTMTSSKKSS